MRQGQSGSYGWRGAAGWQPATVPRSHYQPCSQSRTTAAQCAQEESKLIVVVRYWRPLSSRYGACPLEVWTVSLAVGETVILMTPPVYPY